MSRIVFHRSIGKKPIHADINYNLGQNIWNKVDKSSKIGQDKKKSDIHFCVCFNCYCQRSFKILFKFFRHLSEEFE